MGWLVAIAVREVRKDLDLCGFLISVLRDLNNTIIVVVITIVIIRDNYSKPS